MAIKVRRSLGSLCSNVVASAQRPPDFLPKLRPGLQLRDKFTRSCGGHGLSLAVPPGPVLKVLRPRAFRTAGALALARGVLALLPSVAALPNT